MECQQECDGWILLASRDGIVAVARLPCFGGVDESFEERAGQGADGVGAFGVPLDGEDEVIGRVELDSLDDTIGGGDGGDAKVVAGLTDGLVVAGVHEGLRVLRGAGRFGGAGSQLGQAGSGVIATGWASMTSRPGR